MTSPPPAPVPPVLLRAARPGDAERLARCHLDCWRDAYTEMVDADALAAALAAVDERVERWRQILAGAHGTVVAAAGEDLVGFASSGPPRDDRPDVTLELYALYVRRAHWGTGLGHRLLEAALGQAPASLWVLRDNARARSFYRRHGFSADGTEATDSCFGGAEIRMVRAGAATGSAP